MSPTIYKFGLLLHFIGLAMLFGVTLAGYVSNLQFWREFPVNKEAARAVNKALAPYPKLLGWGTAFLVISGITFMHITKGAFRSQLWFQIKIVFVVLIILNGLFVARPLAKRLKAVLNTDKEISVIQEEGERIRRKAFLFYYLQLVFFLIILIMVSFRFT